MQIFQQQKLDVLYYHLVIRPKDNTMCMSNTKAKEKHEVNS